MLQLQRASSVFDQGLPSSSERFSRVPDLAWIPGLLALEQASTEVGHLASWQRRLVGVHDGSSSDHYSIRERYGVLVTLHPNPGARPLHGFNVRVHGIEQGGKVEGRHSADQSGKLPARRTDAGTHEREFVRPHRNRLSLDENLLNRKLELVRGGCIRIPLPLVALSKEHRAGAHEGRTERGCSVDDQGGVHVAKVGVIGDSRLFNAAGHAVAHANHAGLRIDRDVGRGKVTGCDAGTKVRPTGLKSKSGWRVTAGASRQPSIAPSPAVPSALVVMGTSVAAGHKSWLRRYRSRARQGSMRLRTMAIWPGGQSLGPHLQKGDLLCSVHYPRGGTGPLKRLLAHARKQAWRVFEDEDVVERRITEYYRRESNYAGSTFSDLHPNDPFSIGGSDLLAVHMLSVDIPQIAVRRLAEPCADVGAP